MDPGAALAVVKRLFSKNKGLAVASGFAAVAGLALTQYYAFRPSRSDVIDVPVFTKAVVEPKKEKVSVDKHFVKRLRRLLKIIIPSWRSSEAGQLVVLTFLLLARTMLSIHLADVAGYNARVLVDRKFSKFVRGVLRLGAVAVPASIVNSGLRYVTSTLSLCFRQRLSTYIQDKYLSDLTFYRVTALGSKIDNVDQRITEDTAKFASTLAELYSTTFKPVVDVALYTYKLSQVVGFRGPLAMFLYYLMSSVILRGLMPSFARLTAQQQQLEGNFRFAHSRLVANAEEVAFLGGGGREKSIINRCFQAVFRHSMLMFKKQGGVNIMDGMLVKYGATMVGYAVCAIPVFSAKRRAARLGLDEKDIIAELTRNYVRDSRLLINLATAIGQLVLLYKRITSLAGYTARVAELIELLDQKAAPAAAAPAAAADAAAAGAAAATGLASVPDGVPVPGVLVETDHIEFEHVNIVSPDNMLLIRDLTFRIEPGQNLLVTGPNGCGKSSMFRVLGELWPLTCGRLQKPARQHFFYIPQKPYLALGSLREQIIYPHSVDQMRLRGVSDTDLLALMAAVQLLPIVQREARGLDAVADWTEVLSGGEKQRVAMARLFYHRPKWAVLDECTSAVSVDVEHALYSRCREIGCTLITISHRKTLWKFHDLLLRFNDVGGYEFRPITPDMLPKE